MTKIENPDFGEVIKMAEHYIENFDPDREYETEYFFEEVMMAVYGKDVFTKLYEGEK